MAKSKANAVRWGRIHEISKVKRIFDGRSKTARVTSEFASLPARLKHLAVWRRAHMWGGHSPPHTEGSRVGKSPSSNMTLRQKLSFVRRKEKIVTPERQKRVRGGIFFGQGK